MSRLHNHVLDALGRRIVAGEVPAGHVVMSEELVEEYGVSRSVIREAVRVLGSIGLVESVKRLGVRVLPRERWNVFDPELIRWRLDSPANAEHLRSLTEIRSAAEPRAAELAARHRPEHYGTELVAVAEEMILVGRAGRLEEFLALDVRFHSLVLTASGNDMFRAMSTLVSEVLRGRTVHGLMPTKPHEEALQLHLVVAQSIAAGTPSVALAAMERIVRRADEEMDEIWHDVPRWYPCAQGACAAEDDH